MTSTAGESGTCGGDRCPSGEKGTTTVGRRSKKPSAFHRAVLRFWKKNIENVWQGARNLRLILRICWGVTVRRHQTRRFQLRYLQFFCASKKSVRAFYIPMQGRLKTYVLLCEFLSCMLIVGMFVFVFECNICIYC